MTGFKPLFLAAGAVAVAITLSPLAAEARGGRGGGSDYGDSWINDEIKNPRYIEPYAWADPTRYRAYHHTEGYDDRIRAEYERRRGRVEVAPFRSYR